MKSSHKAENFCPTPELYEALHHAGTFYIPKGRLAPFCIDYLSQTGINVPYALPMQTQTLYDRYGREFIFMPDASIGSYTNAHPSVVGFTGMHQLIEKIHAPNVPKFEQPIVKLEESHFVVACRDGDAPIIREYAKYGRPFLLCGEYQYTSQLLLNNLGVAAFVEEVPPGCTEITLNTTQKYLGGVVIAETETTLRNNGLESALGRLANVEIAATWNI